jgi:hypothetical protein
MKNNEPDSVFCTQIPMVTRCRLASMQVCVPKDFTDEQVVSFANQTNPTGLDHGWGIRRQGDEALDGADERVQCSGRSGCVHIVLDC